MLATLVMTAWAFLADRPPPCKKGEKPPPPRTGPFTFDRRGTIPIGNQCRLSPPEHGVDTHEFRDLCLVALCNMSGLTPVQVTELFEETPAMRFVIVRDPWLPPQVGTDKATWDRMWQDMTVKKSAKRDQWDKLCRAACSQV